MNATNVVLVHGGFVDGLGTNNPYRFVRTEVADDPKNSLGKFGAVLSVVLAFLLISGCATVPLPSEMKIIPPPPHISKEIAAFSGKWTGSWDAQIVHVLVVEELDAQKARVIYAWGSGTFPWGRSPSGWTRVTGEFADKELRLRVPHTGAAVTYRLEADGTLAAVQEGETVIGSAKIRFTSRARMVKAKE